MNPDRQEPQIENVESHIEQAGRPRTFLDKIRKWANNKAMIAATVIGLSGAAACDMPAEKDDTELTNSNNQNELYQGCEPFSMCLTTALYDDETYERIGFSFWYKVPEGQEFEDVTFKVRDLNGNVIGEDTLSLSAGTGQFEVTVPGYDGDFESDQAVEAGGIEVIFANGETVFIENGEATHPDDDDAPSIGQ